MKKQLVVIPFLLYCYSAFAQEQEQNPQLKDSQLSVDIGLPFISVDYEKQLGKSAFTLHSGLSFQYGFFGSTGDFNYYVLPFLEVAPRYYYNLSRRLDKGKDINNNSGSYVTLINRFASQELAFSNDENYLTSSNTIVNVIPAWGFQRAFGKRDRLQFGFQAGFGLGLGIESGEIDTYPAPYLDISLGYIIWNK